MLKFVEDHTDIKIGLDSSQQFPIGIFNFGSLCIEGDEAVEINGIPMAEKSDDEIQLIVGTIREDMELCTRSYSTRNHEMIEMRNNGL